MFANTLPWFNISKDPKEKLGHFVNIYSFFSGQQQIRKALQLTPSKPFMYFPGKLMKLTIPPVGELTLKMHINLLQLILKYTLKNLLVQSKLSTVLQNQTFTRPPASWNPFKQKTNVNCPLCTHNGTTRKYKQSGDPEQLLQSDTNCKNCK